MSSSRDSNENNWWRCWCEFKTHQSYSNHAEIGKKDLDLRFEWLNLHYCLVWPHRSALTCVVLPSAHFGSKRASGQRGGTYSGSHGQACLFLFLGWASLWFFRRTFSFVSNSPWLNFFLGSKQDNSLGFPRISMVSPLPGRLLGASWSFPIQDLPGAQVAYDV